MPACTYCNLSWYKRSLPAERQFQLIDFVIERQPVVGRESVPPNGEAVFPCGIALIPGPAVERILLRQAAHVFVAVGLRKHRCRSDVGVFPVALHDTAIGYRQRRAEPVAVDRQKSRNDRELRHGKRHAFERSIEDVDLVDSPGSNRMNGPRNGFAFDHDSQQFTVPGSHLFRIVEQRVVEAGRKNHRCGEYRSGQTATSGLVTARFGRFILISRFQHLTQRYKKAVESEAVSAFFVTFVRFFPRQRGLTERTETLTSRRERIRNNDGSRNMNADIARQSLITAFLTLAAVAVAALYTGQGGSAVPSDFVPSPLGDPISAFQHGHPTSSRLLALLCLLYTGLSLGRLSVRYNLYAGSCYLTIPLFGMAACGIVCSPEYLTQYLSALLLALSFKHFCLAFRNGYGFNSLFRASLYLGVLCLVSTPAVPLLLLMPLAVFLFRRTLRELIVALFGLLLPAFALCYIAWALGNPFGAPITEIFTDMYTHTGLPEDPSNNFHTIAPLLTAGVLLLLTLTAQIIQLQNMYAVSHKARLILVFGICTFFLSLATLFLPGSFPSTVAFAAVPAALLLPVFFVRAQRDFALAIYLVAVLCTFASILLK